MKLSQLKERIQTLLEKFGDLEIDIITELGTQTEQPLGDIAVSPREKRVKLLPEGF